MGSVQIPLDLGVAAIHFHLFSAKFPPRTLLHRGGCATPLLAQFSGYPRIFPVVFGVLPLKLYGNLGGLGVKDAIARIGHASFKIYGITWEVTREISCM